MEANGLNTKAMLVSLSISMWRCRRRDKKITQETNRRYGAGERAGNYNKNLIPLEEGNSYKAVEQAAANAYSHFRENTLPWLDDGTRILPAANYFRCMEVVRKDREEFNVAKMQFKADLPGLIRGAETVLGPKLFNSDEYPKPDEIDKKFAFSVKVFPLPSSEDFRVSLSGDDMEAIREQIRSETQSAVIDGMREVWLRLQEAVSHFRSKVKDGIVKQAMLDNLKSLCDVLPRLNLTGDSKLEELRRRVSETLGGYDADDLKKKNRRARKKAAEEAARIEDAMKAYMGN